MGLYSINFGLDLDPLEHCFLRFSVACRLRALSSAQHRRFPFERKSDKQRQTLKKIAEIKVCQKIFHSTKDKMASVEERTAFAKLEALKDIR